MSNFTTIVVSVSKDLGKGLLTFPTAINWFASLYNPTVVMYGEKLLPVTLLCRSPKNTFPVCW